MSRRRRGREMALQMLYQRERGESSVADVLERFDPASIKGDDPLPQSRSRKEDKALAYDSMDSSRVRRIREDMERAEARRLRPCHVEKPLLTGGALSHFRARKSPANRQALRSR